jgi:mannose-1-phosphate guanylyltransferase
MNSSNSNRRCGIVLAGGRGLRLRPFIHQLKGSTLPKQYVNFIGERSMLEHTFDRAERLISRERLLTAITRDHLNYREAEEQLSERPAGRVIVQPEDRDTGLSVLLPLMHLYKRHTGATVAVFPSDHFILEEDVFMAHVGMAFYLVESDPSRLVVLGLEPDAPEPEYGYILPDGEVRGSAPSSIRGIRLLMDDLDSAAAQALIERGGLWNTMTLVFKPDTVLDLVRAFFPRLYGLLQDVQKAIGTRKERSVVEDAYRRMEPMDFEKGILQTFLLLRSSRLSVLPVSEVFWSDWKSERTVVDALRQTGYLNRLHGVADGRISANS